jgi:hypothetical protein
MKRILILAIAGLCSLSTGCDVVVAPGAADPVLLPATQFFRITRDEASGTWIGGFVDPGGSESDGG